MIVARVTGGLGNQLFIYAAARRMALKNNVTLKLDTKSGFKWDVNYKRKYLLDKFNIYAQEASLRESYLNCCGRVRRYFTRKINNAMPFDSRCYIKESSADFDPRITKFRVSRSVYLEGYWQSEKYFEDIKYFIKNELQIKADFSRDARTEAELIIKTQNPVCVGIRRFREEKIAYRKLLGMEYYLKAVEIMASQLSGIHFFIVSEEPEWAKENFRIHYPCTFISHKEGDERAYENLWLMSLCKHFIISQSTYQWWGAWLSQNPSKKVIVPAPKLVQVSEDYIPEDWLRTDI